MHPRAQATSDGIGTLQSCPASLTSCEISAAGLAQAPSLQQARSSSFRQLIAGYARSIARSNNKDTGHPLHPPEPYVFYESQTACVPSALIITLPYLPFVCRIRETCAGSWRMIEIARLTQRLHTTKACGIRLLRQPATTGINLPAISPVLPRYYSDESVESLAAWIRHQAHIPHI